MEIIASIIFSHPPTISVVSKPSMSEDELFARASVSIIEY
jgi:hypothetical protein